MNEQHNKRENFTFRKQMGSGLPMPFELSIGDARDLNMSVLSSRLSFFWQIALQLIHADQCALAFD